MAAASRWALSSQRRLDDFDVLLFLLLVSQPFLAASLLLVLRAVLEPPFCPPFRAGAWFSDFPLPDPDFLPPPDVLFTVAHARRSASFLEVPRDS